MTPSEIPAWRKEQRAQLIPARVAIPDATRDAWTRRIIASLEPIVMAAEGPVSFYWPFRGEPNLRPLMRRMIAAGKHVALPVVVQQRQPLEFRPWTPGCTMELGVWNIPIPDTKERVTPRLLVAPVVGFDPQHYRLGYGGAFYDRTLAALHGPRTVIGVGFDAQAIDTIHPLPHDIPMDRIVTESGLLGAEASTELSSPACSLAEAPDAYAGYLDEAEIAAELQALRASSDLADLAFTRALDQLLARLPVASQDQSTAGGNVPISDRLAQLRARVRDDALHAALGEVLRIAQQAEQK
ncbi:5-formyltetrahydrofolate cyclo-ligase [Dongia deserti]|uniref:5-formyltetrahydrofolate cyclo-ligase n=1 Tax=Dongia deserti TaxID=2268030 RepID=UPI000E650A30|nr:5-formyltetrahydrofolate cyclo-ligase [Dongia deserti]